MSDCCDRSSFPSASTFSPWPQWSVEVVAAMVAVGLVFGKLAWGAEGEQTYLFLAAAPFQTASVACEAALIELRPGDAGLALAALCGCSESAATVRIQLASPER